MIKELIEGDRTHSIETGLCILSEKDGKIREGYISLCPVTKETKYRAYMLVF